MALKDRLKSLMNKTIPVSSEVKALRDEGDRLRDVREFAEAAAYYERYLAAKPTDASIWIQRGNCLKDSGSFDSARAAYEEAEKLMSPNADLNVQLGHLMKLQGRRMDAVRYYRKALEIDPNSNNARFELGAMGVKLQAPASPLETPEFARKAANILDISDLIIFLGSNTRVTGIQRVQSCIVQEIINANVSIGLTAGDTMFCYCAQAEQTFYLISATHIKTLLDSISASAVSRHDIDNALRAIFGSRIRLNPRAGDNYVILGAFWLGDDYTSCLWQLKRAQVKLGVYIYDLIPLTYPQFVTDGTRQAVIEKFSDVMSLADYCLTISDYVAKEVTYTLETTLNRKIPVLPVLLAHTLPSEVEESGEEIDDDFKSAMPAEYVLCVCTLEGRKNHLILLNTWLALNQKHGGRIPSLVLVGKKGWRIEEFDTQLHATNNVDGKILHLADLSDRQVKYLYEHCLFTVFPSFVEGWGLPVGESLAYGKPCIASNSSSIPEVGGDLCRYINPYDPVGTLEIIENAILDRPGLQAWTDRIAREFKARTWAEVAQTFLRCVGEASRKASEQRVYAVELAPGRVHWLSRPAIYGGPPSTWRDRTVKFVCAVGWREFEDWGVWSSGRTAEITFRTTSGPDTKIRLLLHLRLPLPQCTDVLRCVDSFGMSTLAKFDNELPKWVSLDTKSNANGEVTINLERNGSIDQVDPGRPVFVGISAIAYHERDDIVGRLDVLESITFLVQRPPSLPKDRRSRQESKQLANHHISKQGRGR